MQALSLAARKTGGSAHWMGMRVAAVIGDPECFADTMHPVQAARDDLPGVPNRVHVMLERLLLAYDVAPP